MPFPDPLRSRSVRRRHRPAQRERGAAIVEFALTAPIFIALGLGVADTGFVFNDTIRLRHSVKEAARLVSSDDFERSIDVTATCAQSTGAFSAPLTDRGKWALCRAVDLVASTGFDRSGIKVRIRMVTPDSGGGFAYVPDEGLGTEANGQGLMVCVMAPTSSRTGLLKAFYDNKVLQNRIILPVSTPDPILADVSLNGQYGTGGDWRFCDPDLDGA